MNSAIVRGRLQQFAGALTARWGRITRNPLRVTTGTHRQMVGGLHAACAQARQDVSRQIDAVHRRSHAFCAKVGGAPIVRMVARRSLLLIR